MKELRSYIKESMSGSSKKVNENIDFDVCYYTENLMGAQASSAAVRIENANDIRKIFGNGKAKVDNSWVSIAKEVKDQYDPSLNYVILAFDSRGGLDIMMAEDDEVEMTLEDSENVQEDNMFSYDEFVSYVNSSLGTNIKDSYIKY